MSNDDDDNGGDDNEFTECFIPLYASDAYMMVVVVVVMMMIHLQKPQVNTSGIIAVLFTESWKIYE